MKFSRYLDAREVNSGTGYVLIFLHKKMYSRLGAKIRLRLKEALQEIVAYKGNDSLRALIAAGTLMAREHQRVCKKEA